MYSTKFLQFGLTLLLCLQLGSTFANNLHNKDHKNNVAGVVLDNFPANWQLYARNTTTNKANVPISGTVQSFSGYETLLVKLYKNDVLSNTFTENLTYSGGFTNFNFTVPINAELSNYTFELVGVDNGAETVEARSEKVVAGDVYCINGQSNAEGQAASDPSDQVEFLRSYTYNYGWNYINFSFPGFWGGHLGYKVVTEAGIPCAIFNQAVGGEQIDFYLRNDNNPSAGNYGDQRQRLDDAGIGSNVRAFIWYQGEADSWNVSTEDYKVNMERLYDAWRADYDLDAVYLFQMRYKSCNSPNPDILEAHRQSANEINGLYVMSTSNAIHDGCHYPYQGGYKVLGSRIFNLINRDVYNQNASNITPPDVSSISVNNNIITIQMTGNGALSQTGNPWSDFELEGGNVSITGGSLSGTTITLNLSGEAAGVTAVSYLGHPGGANDWIFNPKDIGILSFYNFPISNPIPGNGNSGAIDCANVNFSTGNGTIVVSGLDGAPITHLQVFDPNWSVAYSCLNDCDAIESVPLPMGTYNVYVKYYNEDWGFECEVSETLNVLSSGGPGPVDNDNDGVVAADDCDDNNPSIPTTPGSACNDGNSNTTNDIIQSDGCTCEGTNPAPVDNDNDGVVAADDCDDNNPSIPTTPGSACNDGNSNTTNDIIQSDGCTCEGTNPDPVDNDNDGVVAADDCDDNNPAIPTTPGSSCNDGNSSTTNDIIQSDGCTCEGTSSSGGGIDCNNIVIGSNDLTLSVAGLGTAAVSKLQVFTSNWSLVHNCFGDCEDTEILNLAAGDYRVTASLHNSSWQEVCKVSIELTLEEGGSNGGGGNPVDNDNDGTIAADDCDDNDPTIPTSPGSVCNDNNSNTTNDVIQSDGCTCAGTNSGGGGSTGADLELNMTVAESEFIIYEFINYTLTLNNTGTEVAQDITVANLLPTGAVYSNHVSTNSGDYTPWDGKWRVGDLNSGATAILELRLFVLADDQSINNFAQVSAATGDDPDSTPGNNNINTASEDDEANIILPAGQRSTEVIGIPLSQQRFITLVGLYPNPADDALNLEISANEKIAQNIQLYDSFGSLKEVLPIQLEEGINRQRIDISDLPSGMYYLLFETNKRHEPIRFVKQRR